MELICCERGREDPRTKSIQALKIKLIFYGTWPLDSILGSNSIPRIDFPSRPKIPAQLTRQNYLKPIIKYVHFIEAKTHKNHVGFYELFILWFY